MNKIKQEKGSITLFVLVAMLFFVMYLVGMYLLNTNAESAQYAASKRIKEIYEKDIDQMDTVYETITNKNIQTTGTWNKQKKVNNPYLEDTGLVPVLITSTGEVKTIAQNTVDWFDYVDTSVTGKENTSKWANAQTKEGSLWVWIPRFAYRITDNDLSDKTQGGKIEIVFLKGTTNQYEAEDGTEKEATQNGYTIHPAFQNGQTTGYQNGEWNKEIPGFWIAKFEAGYAGQANNEATGKDSNITYQTIQGNDGSNIGEITNYYYGTRTTKTKVKYPIFQANKPSMNQIGIDTAFNLCKDFNKENNPYGLTSKIDSHLTKNSEWGAVAYLAHSCYGRNGKEITINNITVNNQNTIQAITGYAANTISANQNTTTLSNATSKNVPNAYSWEQPQGVLASTTGNVTGIYDLSGGLTEWVAGFISVTGNYDTYGGNLKGDSTNDKSKYAYAQQGQEDISNYSMEANTKSKGEAIWETSQKNGVAISAWHNDNTEFINQQEPFFVRRR